MALARVDGASAPRQQLGRTAEGEDAFQAVFIVPVRKAGPVRKETLASQLFGVTWQVAGRAREKICRRQRLARGAMPKMEAVPPDRAQREREVGGRTLPNG